MGDIPISRNSKNNISVSSSHTHTERKKNPVVLRSIARQTRRFGAAVKNLPSIRSKFDKKTEVEEKSGVAVSTVAIPQGPFYQSPYTGPNHVHLRDIEKDVNSGDESTRLLALMELDSLCGYLQSLDVRDPSAESLSQFGSLKNFKATQAAVDRIRYGSRMGDMNLILAGVSSKFIDPAKYKWDSLKLLEKAEKDAEEVPVSAVLHTLHSVYRELAEAKEISREQVEDARDLVSTAIAQLVQASASASFESAEGSKEPAMEEAAEFLENSVSEAEKLLEALKALEAPAKN